MNLNFGIQAHIEDALAKVKKFYSGVQDIADAAVKAGKIIETALSDAVPEKAFDQFLETLKENIAKAAKEADQLSEAMQGASGDELESLQNEYDTLTAKIEEACKVYEMVETAQENFVKGQEDAIAAEEKQTKTLAELLGGQENYQKIISNLPPGVKSAIGAIDGMTTSAKAFIATPLGAVIAALTLAISALTSWFKNSSEGEMAFAKITGYVSGILDQLKEIAISVGQAIYNAFTNPKQAVTDLWKAIKQNLVNRVEGLGKTFKVLGEMIGAVFSGDFNADKWAQMGKQLADATAEAATGIDNLVDKTTKYGKTLEKAAEKSAEYNRREKQLARERSKWSVEEQKIDNQLAELRNSNGAGGDRQANRAKAEELVNKKYEKRLQFAKEELSIQQGRMALTTNTDADYERENQLKREVLAIEQQRTNEMRRFNSAAQAGLSSAASAAAKSAKQDAKSSEVEYQNQKADEKRKRQLALDTEQAKIDILKEGHEKKMRQIDLNYEKEKEAIKQKEEEIIEIKYQAAKKQWEAANTTPYKGKRTDFSLSDEERDYIKAKNESNENEANKQRKQVLDEQKADMNEYLVQYGTFMEQKQALTEKYENLIQQAREQGKEGQAKIYQKELEDALSGLDFNQLQEKMNWELIFGDLQYQTRESLEKVKEELEKFARSPQFAKAKETDKKTINEAIATLNTAISEKTPIFANVAKAVKARKLAIEELADAEKELREAEITYQIAMEMGSEQQQKEAEKKLREAREKRNGKQSNYQQADANLNKVSSDTAGKVLDVAAAIGQLGDDSENSLSKVGSLISTLFTAIGGQGSKLSQIGGFIGAAFGVFEDVEKNGGIAKHMGNTWRTIGSSILQSFNFGDWMGLQTNIKECQDSIDESNLKNQILTQSLNKLNETIQKSNLSEVSGAADKAKQLTEEMMKNAANNLVKTAEMHGTGRSSLNESVEDNKGFISALKKASEILGKNIISSSQYLQLTAQEQAKIRDYDNGKTLAAILNEYRSEGGIGGRSSDIPDMLLAYIDEYENAFDEITQAANEKLAGVTFDSIESEFESTLNDMEASVEDFGDNLEEQLKKSVIKGVTADFSPELEQWYADLAKAMENGLTQTEADALRASYSKITQDALEARDRALEAFGYDENNKVAASQRSVASMSEETAGELNGRFTSIQISIQEITDTVQTNARYLQSLNATMDEHTNLLHDLNSSVIACNGTLNSLYQSVESGMKAVVNATNQVQSTINSKL